MNKLRIVSLVPSLTKTLADLGLEDHLVGITQFCVLPKGLHKKASVVGGTKDPDIKKIIELEPTCVLANQEENGSRVIESLRGIAPLHVSYPKTVSDVPGMITQIADFISQWYKEEDLKESAEVLARSIEEKKHELENLAKKSSKSFLYLIWKEPYMAASQSTYLSSLLETAGWKNVLSGDVDYPSLEVEDVIEYKADVIFLSTEPFPFRNRQAEQLLDEIKQRSDHYDPVVQKIDGRLMSWHGSMTLVALDALSDYLTGEESELIEDFFESC